MITQAAVEKSMKLADRLDEKLSKTRGYKSAWIGDSLRLLLDKGSVEVGWRESCGTTDFTMRVYREWKKVVKLLRGGGIHVGEEPVKHKNAWATKSGGFWRSIIYSIPAPIAANDQVAAGADNGRSE